MEQKPALLQRLKKAAVEYSTVITVVIGACSLALPPVQSAVQTVLGTKAIQEDLSTFKFETEETFTSLKLDLATLRGDFDIAIFDDNQSFIEGPCFIGEECVARFAVKRTPFGADCGAPDPSPKVRNHWGRKLAAEGVTGAVKVGDREFDLLDFTFIVPSKALPGRGTMWIELDYPCPDGNREGETNTIPFEIYSRDDK